MRVTAPAQIIQGPRDMKVVWGSEVVLECEVVGIPFPSRSWTKNGKVVSIYTNSCLSYICRTYIHTYIFISQKSRHEDIASTM